MIRPTTVVLGIALIAATAVPLAQEQRALTTADYDRAVRMLAPALNNLVLTRSYNDRVPAGDYRLAEWAGVSYSPDGQWLFANIQTPGITFAIKGPWGDGPL